jgi:zinc D-Ala-D-Ala carboxypeptidase
MEEWPYFPIPELTCRCGCNRCIMDESFMGRIEAAREKCDFPWIVDSAYRCDKHDKEIRGDGNHPTGEAIDVRFSNLDQMLDAMAQLRLQGFRRFGFCFKGLWLHVDCVPYHPIPAVWLYAPEVRAEPE